MDDDEATAAGRHRPIHIALTFDDKYWALAYAVMRSVCLTTTRRTDVVFHLCHTRLTASHAPVLETIADEFGASLAHYDPTSSPAFRELAALLPSTERFPTIVYARLILDQLLPQGTGRVIYLDCDVMVCRPIELLYEQDMHGKPLAAVPDPHHLGIKKGHDIRSKTNPFDTAEPYFNSGVVLLDLDLLAKAEVTARLRQMQFEGWLQNIYYDQDLMNLLFRDRWQPLAWIFNVVRPRLAHEAMNPVIVHYTGSQQPWNLWSPAAFHRLYRHVMTNEVYYRFWRERQVARWTKRWRRSEEQA